MSGRDWIANDDKKARDEYSKRNTPNPTPPVKPTDYGNSDRSSNSNSNWNNQPGSGWNKKK